MRRARRDVAEVLVDVAQVFPMLGLTLPPQAAFAETEDDATACALCGSTPLGPRASLAQTIAWLDRFDPPASGELRVQLSEGEGANALRYGSDGDAPDWHEFRSRAVSDSRLTLAIALPEHLFDRIAPELDDALATFVADQLAVPVCERCLLAPSDAARVLATVLDAYVRVRFDGNVAAARVQPSWPLAERFAALVERAFESERQAS